MNKKIDSEKGKSNSKVVIGLVIVIVLFILGGLFFAKDSLHDGASISDVNQNNVEARSSGGMGNIGTVSNANDNSASSPSDDVDMIDREERLNGNSGIGDTDGVGMDGVQSASGMGQIGDASNADDKSSSSPTDNVDMFEREEQLKGNTGISDADTESLNAQSPSSSKQMGPTSSNVKAPISVTSDDVDFIKNRENYHVFVVTFDFESTEIRPSESGALAKVADSWKSKSNAEVIVCGYTCDFGSIDVNNWISEHRAIAVKKALKSLGVPNERIKLYWYGKTKNNPQSAPNKENRKCEILIHK